MTIIDFGFRPPTDEFKANLRAFAEFQGVTIDTAWYNASVEDCIEEMEELDVIGVVPGRVIPSAPVSNESIKQLADKYPKRFIPFAGIDPVARAWQEEIAKIAKWGFKGVEIEPGHLSPPMAATDRHLYPFYKQCEDLGLIVILQLGTRLAHWSHNLPLPLEEVARDFPKLQIILCHSCYPFVGETILLQLRNENIWVSPDTYQSRPLAGTWVDAANFVEKHRKVAFSDRYLYATRYPFSNPRQYLETWKKLPWKEEVAEKCLYKNAANLLGLES